MPGTPDKLNLYTFGEAAALFQSAKITERSLRTEHDKGNLRVTWIAGKKFVTLSALWEMIDGNTAPVPERASSDLPATREGGGSVRKARALKAARRRGAAQGPR